MVDVVAWLRTTLETVGAAHLTVQTPAAQPSLWPGERDASGVRYRPLRGWLDLADALGAHMTLPTPHPSVHGAASLTFQRRAGEASLHDPRRTVEERYAADGAFARLDKADHPGFLLPLQDALRFAMPSLPRRTLVAGCFAGTELDVLTAPPFSLPASTIVGIDVNASALERASSKHPDATFVHANLGSLPADPSSEVPLGRFSLLLAVDVLSSSTLDGPKVLAALVQQHATPACGIVIGVPASRLVDGEVVWGARTRNYRETDLSRAVRDLAGHRRYLHQHGFTTRITGKYDLLLTGRRSESSAS